MSTPIMRRSRVLQQLRSGAIVHSIKLNFADARIAEMAALLGIDCIWTDMEHVANDWSIIENQIRAAKVHDTDTIVRVARGSYSDYIRPLELDAAGIMVPHVKSAAEAEEIVRAVKFYPIGLRPVDGGNADGSYCLIPITDYIHQANAERFVILQIEDPEPLAEIDRIAQLPGVDMLFFGPGDFSQAIGAPGQLEHPQVCEARIRVAEAAVRAGIFAGTVGTPDNSAELAKLGYRFINIGSDVNGLGSYFRRLAGRQPESVHQRGGY
ncbi:HpcH/HpaI aldolase family protein [Paenibacillus oceani]|uniref:Aldolase n=1 Tax=Paenibacillus oceani TaxID=2772510 RepID=A0A927H297_9BACL|nr:aldolase/citrate lyase family protein [Paenibacillus oceani]MBD2865595.1 aldolase [Paenibacillus oceani]